METLEFLPDADGDALNIQHYPMVFHGIPVAAWQTVRDNDDGTYLFDNGIACFTVDLDRVPLFAKVLTVRERLRVAWGGNVDQPEIYQTPMIWPALLIDGVRFEGTALDLNNGATWHSTAWPENPATGLPWKAHELQGTRVQPAGRVLCAGVPINTGTIYEVRLEVDIEIHGPRETILTFIEGLLNPLPLPPGIPPGTRAPRVTTPVENLPSIDFWPVLDRVMGIHEGGAGAPVPSPPADTPAEQVVRRLLDVGIRCTARGTEISTPDAELDPLCSWVEQTLVGADWASIGAISATKVAEEIDETIRDAAVASSLVLFRVHYTTRAGDPSVPI